MALDRMLEDATRRLRLTATANVARSDAYATLASAVPATRLQQALDTAIKRTMAWYAATGSMPSAYVTTLPGSETAPTRLQRRLRHLNGLLIRTQGEQQELDTIVDEAGIAPTERRPWYRRLFGRGGTAAAYHAEPTAPAQERPRPAYRPLERITEDAARAYNVVIQAGKEGDTRAVHQRYRRGAAAMGLEESVYKDALREHVRMAREESKAVFAARCGGPLARVHPRSRLARFDRELLQDKEAYASEVLDLYLNSGLRLREIAELQGQRYGMRISVSSISRMARAQLASRGLEGLSRAEAQRRDGYAAWLARREARPAA